MDSNQAKIVELLREVHLIAFKEIERLNLRIAELENQRGHRVNEAIDKPSVSRPPEPNSVSPALPEMMNDYQVALHLNVSVASLRRWRMLAKGPKFLRIGSMVRYRRQDLEAWLNARLAAR